MRAVKFPQATRALQPPKGLNEDDCLPLYVFDGLIEMNRPGLGKIPCLLSKWELDEEDRARVAAGAPVWLWVYGNKMPPMALETGDPFSPERRPRA